MDALKRFAQHLALAQDSYALVHPLSKQFAKAVFGASELALDELVLQVGMAWFILWENASSARDIAADLGRDVSEFDALRAKLRSRTPEAISYVLSPVHPTTFPPGQQLAYRDFEGLVALFRVPEDEIAQAALDVLARAVPDVVIVRQAEDPTPAVSLSPSRLPLLIAVAVLAVGGGLAILLLR
jgi:hypothetical protein